MKTFDWLAWICIAYYYLIRFDREWFEANVPKNKPAQKKSEINWEERDEAGLILVSQICANILRRRPVVFLSHNIILEEVGRRISRHLDQLPKTNELIKNSVETREEYHIRKLKTIADSYIEQGKKPKSRQVLRDAYMNNKKYHWTIPMIDGYIEAQVNARQEGHYNIQRNCIIYF